MRDVVGHPIPNVLAVFPCRDELRKFRVYRHGEDEEKSLYIDSVGTDRSIDVLTRLDQSGQWWSHPGCKDDGSVGSNHFLKYIKLNR